MSFADTREIEIAKPTEVYNKKQAIPSALKKPAEDAYGSPVEYRPEEVRDAIKDIGSPVIRNELQLIKPIHYLMPMPDLLEVFKQYPQYTYFPVVDDQNCPMGIIREQDLKKFVYSRFGSTLLENPVLKNQLSNFIEPCTIVDVQDKNEQILKSYSESGTTEGVIVTGSAKYLGIISLQSLIKLGHERELSLQEAHNQILERRNNDINSILRNMKQGIFTILEDGTIYHEYSAYLETIFETEKIEGRHYFDLLFQNSNLSKDKLSQNKTSIENCLGEDVMMFEVNSHLFIERYQLNLPEDRQKHIELFWNPVVDEAEVIRRIVVNIRDITEIVKLQQKADQQQKEFNLISQVFSISHESFELFIESSRKYVQSALGLLEQHDTFNLSVIAHIFRNLHTIKGNSRLYGFDDLASVVHDVEEMVTKVRSREISYHRQELKDEINKVEETLERYNSIIKEKLQGFLKTKQRGVFLDEQLFKALNDTIMNETCDSLPDSINTIIKSKKILEATNTVSLVSVFNEINESMASMAQIAGKLKPNLYMNSNKIRVSREISSILNIVIMHSIRNSLSHGIEDPITRKKLGKNQTGSIYLEAVLTDERLSIKYWDDGAGLDLQKIAVKARESGLIKIDKPLGARQVARFIFSPGLSTANEVTEISGRGVGMDAILKAITGVKGTIDILLQDKALKKTKKQPFKFIFHLPAEHASTLE